MSKMSVPVEIGKFSHDGYEVVLYLLHKSVWSKDIPKRIIIDGKKYYCFGYKVFFSNVVLDSNFEEQCDVGACVEKALSDIKSHSRRLESM